jgi:hypothetical protein
MEKLHFIPLNYPPIFTFTSKVSSVTLNPLKLSNCGNLTPSAYLFPKCPHHILKKKSKKKKEKTNIYMLGWPATSFGLGWFGHPQAGQSGGG